MTHIWLRAEQRPNENRVGLTPQGVTQLMGAGYDITVERSLTRVVPDHAYAKTGCTMVDTHSWPTAPRDAIILGLKELPDDTGPLVHKHIMFGHAYKGQPDGQHLLRRFKTGGGVLLDLENLTDEHGKRVAAFGYWAGFAGAAISLQCWAAAKLGKSIVPAKRYANATELTDSVAALVNQIEQPPAAIIIGALGRVGTGAADMCNAIGATITKWDMVETASGGPFADILKHDLFFNCILAGPNTPVFVPQSACTAARKLTMVGDISCDPDSAYSPIKVYDRATTWEAPTIRAHRDPVLDVMAIDNLPSMLPHESSEDFADQLLPVLMSLNSLETGVWGRAKQVFDQHISALLE